MDKMKKINEKDMKNDPDFNYRVISVLCYFVVLVIIGIPVWWYTTRVYRAPLPLDRMSNIDLIQNERNNKQFGIPLSLDYDILITVVNPNPEKLQIDLNGESIEFGLQPFLNQLYPVANFIVKSQWLYLVELSPYLRKIVDHYVLDEKQLPHIITPLETKLWSHLSPKPCLNLVLYVSQCEVPLFIRNKQEEIVKINSFYSPRWGGIYIMNPDKVACENKLFQPDLNPIISTFKQFLLNMFEIENTTSSELINLQKRKSQEMIASTRRTLKSLSQLLSEISSIVISDDVSDKIKAAILDADLAEQHLNSELFEESLLVARRAFKNAEDAFSDPSLLALLYFPDDQKYAVYIPLFLPVMIPVLMSLVTLAKWYFHRNNTKDKLE